MNSLKTESCNPVVSLEVCWFVQRQHLMSLLLCLLFSSLQLKVNGQHSSGDELNFVPNSILPAPVEASSINKGGDVSVNLSVGTPSVSIPIADVKSRFIKFGVSLNYSSNGIRVNELAPATGLGWSLNGGGTVTRTTLGLPDEDRVIYNGGDDNFTVPSVTPMTRSVANYLNAFKDRESDIFSFSVGGYINGKFILDHNFQPVLINHANYKISLITSSVKDGFKIIDDKGMIFLFTEKDTSYFNRGDCAADAGERVRPVVNAWHLSKIIKPYQDTVYFYYTDNNYKYLADVTQNESICITSGIGGCGEGSPAPTCPLFVSSFTTCQTQQEVKGKVLSEIRFTTGRLLFEYTGERKDMFGGKALKSVSLMNEQDTLRYVRLVTDYVKSTQNGFVAMDTTLRYRLYLRAVEIGGSKARENEYSYQFSYLQEEILPGRLSTQQDKYGLYNARNGQYFLTSIEDEYPEINYYDMGYPRRYGDRSVNPEVMTAGLLKRIRYPTGGYDSLVYGANITKVEKIIKHPVTTQSLICPLTSAGQKDTSYFTIPMKQVVKMSLWVYRNSPLGGVHDWGRWDIYKVGNPTRIATRSVLGDAGAEPTIDEIELDPGDYMLIDAMERNSMCAERYMTYENQLPDTVWVEEPAGGVSIASVISTDPASGNQLVKKYVYRYRESGETSTFRVSENEKFVFTNVVRRFMNCENFYDCEGLSYCTYLVHGGSQILPESVIGGSHFYHEAVIESITGKDSIDRSTEHIFRFNTTIMGRVENGAFIPGTPYGIVPDFLIGEERTNQYSYNRLTNQTKFFSKTKRDFEVNEETLVENFNVQQIYQSPCSGGTTVTSVERGAYNIQVYPIVRQRIHLTKEIDTIYASNGSDYMVNVRTNTYSGAPYWVLKTTSSLGSKGLPLSEEFTYIFDETANPVNPALIGQNKLVVTSVASFLNANLKEKKYVYYNALNGAPDIISDYKVDEQIGQGPITNLSEKTKFDQFGNVLEAKVNEMYSSFIWGVDRSAVIATVENARYNEIAYTSFEGQDGDNWNIPSTARNGTAAATGNASFEMSWAGGSGISKEGLDASRKYTVSYWSNSSTPFSVAGTTGNVVKGESINGWTHYIHTVTGVSVTSVSGSGLIDELRLHPENASMKTYAHIPHVGVASTCDAKGEILYYKYDGMGRLIVVKDARGNIVRQNDYRYDSSAY